MSEQTINMILQLAEQGGSMALWMFLVAQLKPVIIWGMVLLSVSWGLVKVCKVCKESHDIDERDSKRNSEQWLIENQKAVKDYHSIARMVE